MKIIYIDKGRFPTEKAHGYQICKMCSEYAKQGIKTELWVPTRDNDIKEDIYSYYGISNNFKIKYIKSYDFLRHVKSLGVFSFYLQSLYYFVILFFIKVDQKALIYTRNPEIAWLFKIMGHKVLYEAHFWPNTKSGFYKFLLKKTDYIVSNSHGTAKAYEAHGFQNILVAPNGVELNDFDIKENQRELREKLKLPLDKKIAMYVGHLYDWKGADVLIETAENLKNNTDIILILIGGTKVDIKKYQNVIKNKNLKNIILLGHKPKDQIPSLLKSADVLLLPNIPVSIESEQYTSPIKMFEYMASGIPIIASDLPAIREILNNNNSFLSPAGDAKELGRTIKQVLNNKESSESKAEQAHRDVQKYTWENRAKKIIKKIQNYEKEN